jgi:prepilin-type N-terminal cleavage/methylation domain-containing protein
MKARFLLSCEAKTSPIEGLPLVQAAPSESRPSGVRAFTLIELVATLLLAALLATAVAVSLKGIGKEAQFDETVSRIRSFDDASRRQAKASGRPLRIQIDLDRGRISCLEEGQNGNGPVVNDRSESNRTALDLPPGPSGVKIERLERADDSAPGGEVEIPCSARGHTPTYALLLTGQGRRQWLLFAGLTGQVRIIADERELQDTFRLLGATGGHDAD